MRREIRVNPYKFNYGDGKGSLTILMDIAKEVECDVDYGSWNSCVTYMPEDDVQFNKVTELLDAFEFEYRS
ncbi:hypothetical protein ST201phi2-1p387 [Pseudomonas phage 201phi2-1]|uniref:Uncharacterized protein n=1 Tax=Pseudomonas phage 201phi2-1 TaxID=198110 RepID=B3FJP7_BP201|nr:hypothetical protein ST201phi2-1p387 [Pseudomonas phage 201phi2-1]ABY63212.1 hypothetical protein 201phi2-1p387 [Pseudomonas phage 201phi2-1]